MESGKVCLMISDSKIILNIEKERKWKPHLKVVNLLLFETK